MTSSASLREVKPDELQITLKIRCQKGCSHTLKKCADSRRAVQGGSIFLKFPEIALKIYSLKRRVELKGEFIDTSGLISTPQVPCGSFSGHKSPCATRHTRSNERIRKLAFQLMPQKSPQCNARGRAIITSLRQLRSFPRTLNAADFNQKVKIVPSKSSPEGCELQAWCVRTNARTATAWSCGRSPFVHTRITKLAMRRGSHYLSVFEGKVATRRELGRELSGHNRNPFVSLSTGQRSIGFSALSVIIKLDLNWGLE